MVPLVPKLAVTVPERVFPVPMAPIMLSPPPALTSTPGFKPSSFAVAAESCPAGWSLEIRRGSFAARSPPTALSTASDHLRLRTSRIAVPLASPYSITASPVSQKFR